MNGYGGVVSLLLLLCGLIAQLEQSCTYPIVLKSGALSQLPCVVFFKVHDEQIEDIKIAQLDSGDLIHGFHELYVAVERYLIAESSAQAPQSRALKWLRGASKFVGLELFRAALRRAFESFF
jgi:hypothetical protein